MYLSFSWLWNSCSTSRCCVQVPGRTKEVKTACFLIKICHFYQENNGFPVSPTQWTLTYISFTWCGHMATLAAREAGDMNISNWALLLTRQKERMASRIASRICFEVSTSQGLLGRFYEIINAHKTFRTWNRANSIDSVCLYYAALPVFIHSFIHPASIYCVLGTAYSPGDMTETVPAFWHSQWVGKMGKEINSLHCSQCHRGSECPFMSEFSYCCGPTS